MKTAFSTGPGFYAASSRKADDTVPADAMRFFCARIEAYEGPLARGTDDANTTFTLLPAMADGRKDVARALVLLQEVLTANIEMLKREAR